MLHYDFIATDQGTAFAILQLADRETDRQLDSVVEISRKEEIVWRWEARDWVDLSEEPYHGMEKRVPGARDWLHINSIDRFPDGDLLLCLRNLNRLVRVDHPSGEISTTPFRPRRAT